MQVILLKQRLGSQGGLEKYARRIAAGFLSVEANVSLLTADANGQILLPGISVHSVKTSRWPSFLRMEQYDRFVQDYLEKNPAQIVFGMGRNRIQTHLRAGNGVHAAYLKNRALAEGKLKQLSCFLNPLHRKILQFEKCAFENPNLRKLYTNSYQVRHEILDHYTVDPAKIEVIHNGVEWEEFAPHFQSFALQKEKIAQDLALDPNMFHLLFVGNGYLRKGLLQLLKALAHLKDPQVHLSILGKDNRHEEYRDIATKLGLTAHQVRFFGPQKEVTPFYQLCDALVIPSFYDPFANVTVEALAMGLFVVSSKSNGGHEILTPQNGTVIEDLMDIDSVVLSLKRALSQRKTIQSATNIRNSVRHLDFSSQMAQLIDSCIHS